MQFPGCKDSFSCQSPLKCQASLLASLHPTLRLLTGSSPQWHFRISSALQLPVQSGTSTRFLIKSPAGRLREHSTSFFVFRKPRNKGRQEKCRLIPPHAKRTCKRMKRPFSTGPFTAFLFQRQFPEKPGRRLKASPARDRRCLARRRSPSSSRPGGAACCSRDSCGQLRPYGPRPCPPAPCRRPRIHRPDAARRRP